MSKNILFVAICRTLGVPARLNPKDSGVEYYRNGAFYSPITKELPRGKVDIIGNREDNWSYLSNWSLAILENGVYKTLKLDCKPWEVKDILLVPGTYRLITGNRLPNGNIYAKKYDFLVEEGKKTEVRIELRKFKLEDMLIHVRLFDATFADRQEKEILLSQVLTGKKNLLFWLGENEEPTEHVLNELGEHKDLFESLDCSITFILRDLEAVKNPGIRRVLGMLPKINVCYDFGFSQQELIARNLYVGPEQLPLVVVLKEEMTAVYASSGYNVGVLGLVEEIVRGV